MGRNEQRADGKQRSVDALYRWRANNTEIIRSQSELIGQTCRLFAWALQWCFIRCSFQRQLQRSYEAAANPPLRFHRVSTLIESPGNQKIRPQSAAHFALLRSLRCHQSGPRPAWRQPRRRPLRIDAYEGSPKATTSAHLPSPLESIHLEVRTVARPSLERTPSH